MIPAGWRTMLQWSKSSFKCVEAKLEIVKDYCPPYHPIWCLLTFLIRLYETKMFIKVKYNRFREFDSNIKSLQAVEPKIVLNRNRNLLNSKKARKKCLKQLLHLFNLLSIFFLFKSYGHWKLMNITF